MPLCMLACMVHDTQFNEECTQNTCIMYRLSEGEADGAASTQGKEVIFCSTRGQQVILGRSRRASSLGRDGVKLRVHVCVCVCVCGHLSTLHAMILVLPNLTWRARLCARVMSVPKAPTDSSCIRRRAASNCASISCTLVCARHVHAPACNASSCSLSLFLSLPLTLAGCLSLSQARAFCLRAL